MALPASPKPLLYERASEKAFAEQQQALQAAQSQLAGFAQVSESLNALCREAQASVDEIDRLCEDAEAFVRRNQTQLNKVHMRLHLLSEKSRDLFVGFDGRGGIGSPSAAQSPERTTGRGGVAGSAKWPVALDPAASLSSTALPSMASSRAAMDNLLVDEEARTPRSALSSGYAFCSPGAARYADALPVPRPADAGPRSNTSRSGSAAARSRSPQVAGNSGSSRRTGAATKLSGVKCLKSASAAPCQRTDMGGWPKGDPDKWQFELKDGFRIDVTTENKVPPIVVNTKAEAVAMVKSAPQTFMGCMWVQEGFVGKAKVYPRTCDFYGSGFSQNTSQPEATGAMRASYNLLPQQVSIRPCAYTDTCLARFQSRPMSSRSPGRGQGILDRPGVKIVNEIDPGDVVQGSVGNCWFLSALSALAEFDDAVSTLFKGREDLHLPPSENFGKYTVQLYDLGTWQPVDVVVDERLIYDEERGNLLGCQPTMQGDLWACILEKAVAAHCGGWDKVDGGQPTHAWRMLTGCREVYTIRQDAGNSYSCLGAFNPNTKQWEKLANSPHDGFQGLWPMQWPELGGGGDIGQTLSGAEVFARMCAWDDANFIMAAGTKDGSDTHTTAGIVDGHAYTIISCIQNAGGSGFDMLKVRNPWGKQEFERGGWTDGGPNWKRYPAVFEACGRPVARDDGIFWLEKKDFFEYFGTVYLCAHDMAHFTGAHLKGTQTASAGRKLLNQPDEDDKSNGICGQNGYGRHGSSRHGGDSSKRSAGHRAGSISGGGGGGASGKPGLGGSGRTGDVPHVGGLSKLPQQDTGKWHFDERDGFQISLTTANKVAPIEVGSKAEAIRMVKSAPEKYFGCSWVQEGYVGGATVYPRSCEFFHGGFGPNQQQPDATGAMKAHYVMLPADVPIKPDNYTDSLLSQYQGRSCTAKSPGRGQGLLDRPGLKIVDDIDPSDINQGSVGDCWFLSALSALAEFDSAVATLFKGRRDLHLPLPGEFATYTISMYDMQTWKPVNVEIDERLIWDNQSGSLLGCRPTKGGDLWACLLEKAFAAHCGGWDKIDGGQPTHAWRILTGCREVYTVCTNGGDDAFCCWGTYNPNKRCWEPLANSPHDGFQGLWPMNWPRVGGGEDMDSSLDQIGVFDKMASWSAANWIMAAGSKAGSDKNKTRGIVDGHAYTILKCIVQAGGTNFDMIQLRNPWGAQEYECGGWTDGGPNWKRYPEVYQACGRPQACDDGIFWMQREDFFKYFSTIYVCAHDMANFVAATRSVDAELRTLRNGNGGAASAWKSPGVDADMKPPHSHVHHHHARHSSHYHLH
eukprot:TRINITY_DN20488_c0_g1_i1.p1 TRINITY_DN20488_c0_g1~~TRINITY_DN20488_c0_g1_i1.p1  ORF type:complete len:1316 (+),score=273.32 TRINITY_DN20488_c0_g1_i1:27-3950(+)